MQLVFARQEAIVQEAMAAHGGYVYKTIGDAFQVAFSTTSDALVAALAAQRALHAEPWGPIGTLNRMLCLPTAASCRFDDTGGCLLAAGRPSCVLVRINPRIDPRINDNPPGLLVC